MGRLLDSRGERIDSRLSSLRRNLSRPIGIALALIVVTVGIAQHPRQWLLLAAMASPLALFTLAVWTFVTVAERREAREVSDAQR